MRSAFALLELFSISRELPTENGKKRISAHENTVLLYSMNGKLSMIF